MLICLCVRIQQWGHLKLAAIDPYMWGSLMYLVAAGLYMWGRWWPDYLANHQVRVVIRA